MSQLRIMENRLFDDGLTITESSENSNFPASNLQKHFRSKVWRSNANGNFVIDSSNNAFDFDEGGSELNATISTGTFTSATLATEIQTQLTSTGGDTYTVSYSTGTGLFTIASDGGTLNLLWNTGTNTGTTIGGTIGFLIAADDTGSTSYVGDNIAIHTEETVTINFGSAVAVDSVAIFNDGETDFNLSSTATVQIQGNASDSWGSPSVNQTLTRDVARKIFTHFFASDQTFQYWRLRVVDVDNTDLFIEIPSLVLSDSTLLAQNPQQGFKYAEKDRSKNTTNLYGNRYTDKYPIQKTLSFNYKILTEADLETLFQIFERVGTFEPITVAMDPLETILEKDRFIIYGYLKSVDATQAFTDSFDTGLSLVEAF